jgi:putative hydrolase of the HAD superfamily
MTCPADEPAAYVFDLDGVVREFHADSREALIETSLGLPAGALMQVAFRPDLVEPTITGRQTFEQWYGAICLALEAVVPEPARVREHMELWRAHRGTPIDETVERIRALRGNGHRTYVFTNGTDLVPQELELLGLTDLFDRVLNSADFGVAKPDRRAFEAAHQAIEAELGPLDPAAVWFTDDRMDNVAAAAEFGWQALLFEPASLPRRGPDPAG